MLNRSHSVLGKALLVAALVLPAASQAALIGTFEQLSPVPTAYTEGIHFETFLDTPGAAVGDVTGVLFPVDVTGLGSGCDAADFAGFPAGRIALMGRGVCTFAQKILNAAAAGATGALIFNNIPDAMLGGGVFEGSLLDTSTLIPALFLSNSLGQTFVQELPATVHISVARVADPTVPEPGTLALFALGLVACRFASRRLRA